MGILTRVRVMALVLAAVLFVGAVSARAEHDWFAPLPRRSAFITKKKPRILFVGNSHTFKNKMPEMFRRLCVQQGIDPHVTVLAKGRHSLYEFLYPDGEDAESVRLGRELRRLLKKKKWDAVVLQDRSYEAVANPEKMRQAVRELDAMVRQAGARTVLYMTWAPKKGNASYQKHAGERGKTPDAYLSRVWKMYAGLSATYETALAPVGMAFRRGKEILPSISLLSDDGLHASTSGSYLAACVLYATIFGKSPEGNPYRPDGLAGTEKARARVAEKLQALSADVTVRAEAHNNAKLRFAEQSVTLEKGERTRLRWEITPEKSACRIASWHSSNRRVVRVQDGVLVARRPGKAVITARLNNGTKKATCAVTVTRRQAPKATLVWEVQGVE